MNKRFKQLFEIIDSTNFFSHSLIAKDRQLTLGIFASVVALLCRDRSLRDFFRDLSLVTCDSFLDADCAGYAVFKMATDLLCCGFIKKYGFIVDFVVKIVMA